MESDSDLKFWTTPNILTLVRLGMLPIIVPLLLIGWGEGVGDGDGRLLMIAFILSCFAEMTDLTDGFIARTTGQISRFGKLLDPLADSLTRIITYMTFYAMDLIPLWMVIIFFVREHSVSYYRAFAANLGTVMAATRTGKIKSAVQVTSTLLGGLFLVLASHEQLGSAESRNFMLGTWTVGSVLYFGYIFGIKLRGWLLWLLVGLYPIALAGFCAVTFAPLPDFDPAPFVFVFVLIAAVVTLWSFVDYTFALARSVRESGSTHSE